MNRRKSLLMPALAALVAGAAALVYAKHDEPALRSRAAHGGDVSGPAGTQIAEATPAKPAGESGAKAPEVLYDFAALPEPVQRMIEEIVVAAQSGDIENMRPVLESNELKPMVAASHVDDPITLWKKQSADGSGRDVLAAMLNVLAVGYVKADTGQDEMFVWPYFAETNLTKLTPAQEVELYRIVPPTEAVGMKKAGKYGFYRLGISPAGVWHYFLR